MKLKSFGCSFVYGNDLADTIMLSGQRARPSSSTYPALIAKAKDLDYCCHARPGAGNFEIANRVIAELDDADNAMFVINWTWIERFSYIDNTKEIINRPFNPLEWKSITPVDRDHIADAYYKHMHTQLRDKIETLSCIKLVIDCLQANNLAFIMTWTDLLMWETQWHCPQSVAWLQSHVRPWLGDFQSQGFYDWSKTNGFALGPTAHPLETAHRAAADMILDQWDQYCKS